MIVPNGCSPSTTFVWRKVKITPAPQAQGTARAKRARQAGKGDQRRGLPRQQITVGVRYRGGAEAWWELTYAGQTFRIEGYHLLHDVLRWVYEGVDRPRQTKSSTIPEDRPDDCP